MLFWDFDISMTMVVGLLCGRCVFENWSSDILRILSLLFLLLERGIEDGNAWIID